jgi:hypothetical protein
MSITFEGAGPDRSPSTAGENESATASNVILLHPAINAAVKAVVEPAMSCQPASLPVSRRATSCATDTSARCA